MSRRAPVFVDFPGEIRDEADMPLSCPLPPAHDPSAHPAVSEAAALRPAHNRTIGAVSWTAVHRVLTPAGVPDALGKLAQIVDGAPVEQVELPGQLSDVMLDIRAYYEEAAPALAEHTPAARQTESWFYQNTNAGRLSLQIRKNLQDRGAPQPEWVFLAPITQQLHSDIGA